MRRAVVAVVALVLLPVSAAAQEPEGFRPTLELGGLVQLDYRRADAAGGAARHEMTPRRVRVGLSGLAAPRLGYLVGLEGDNADDVRVLDAAVRFALDDRLDVRVGQFKFDFDLSGREVVAAVPLNDRPWVTNTVAGGLDGGGTPGRSGGRFRDRGLALSGKVGAGALDLAWSAGAFQGTGIRPDDDDAVTGVLRLQVSPASLPVLVTGGFLSGPTRAGARSGEYRAWTTGIAWDAPRLLARAELYRARRERGPVVEDVEGFYGEGVVTAARDLDLAVRFQRIEDPAALSSGAARSVDLGAEWFFRRRPRRRGTSLAANLMLRDAPDEARLTGFPLLNDGRGPAVQTGAELGVAFSLRLQVEF